MARATSAQNNTDVATENAAIESENAAPQRRGGGPPCPENTAHTHTQVYKTRGSVQYCKCDDCGTTWKRPRPAESAGGVSTEAMLKLADTFETAPQIQHGDRIVIVIPVEDAKRTAKRIRELCEN